MFLELANFLDITSSKLNKNNGYNILIIEHSKTSQANFIISHQISSYLEADHEVCLVAFSQTFTHYKSISKKLAMDLSSYVQNNKFSFINGLEFISNVCDNEEKIKKIDEKNFIKNLFLKISEIITSSNSDSQKLLIIDDISILLSLGCDFFLVSMLFDHLIRLNENDSKFFFNCLIHYNDKDDELIKLKNILIRKHDVILTVSPLKTGYCRDITGQISVEWIKEDEGEFVSASHSQKKAHYKLTDRTCSVFPIGLSTALV